MDSTSIPIHWCFRAKHRATLARSLAVFTLPWAALLVDQNSIAQAKPIRIEPLSKQAIKKLPDGVKIPDIQPVPIQDRIGERLRLHIWSVLQPGVQPVGPDGKLALYGSLKINDEERWALTREQAITRAPGERIEISEDTVHTKGGAFEFLALYGVNSKWRGTPEFRMVLSSLNGQNPRRLAFYIDAVELLKWTGKEYRFRNGGGGAMMFMTVERLGYVYKQTRPRGERPTPTPTSTSTPNPNWPRPRPRG